MNTLHILGQVVWHDDAEIVGDIDALEGLRAALSVAIAGGRGSCSTFAADGEGYEIHVRCLSEQDMDLQPVPYTDPIARGRK